MEKTSVIETISTVNRDSGFSNNIMAYRLTLIMENNPLLSQSDIVLDNLQRESIKDQLRTTLSQQTQLTDNYRQTLKNKYYEEYIQKFGVNRQNQSSSSVAQPQLDTSIRVNKLIETRKQNYIQRFLNAGQRKSNEVTVNQQPQNSHQTTPKTQQTETTKTSLISAAINTVLTRGKDTEQGRVYDGIIYRLQLLAKEGAQRINIIRKQGKQGLAFSAYKDDGNEFKINQNNLSPEETARIIAFDQQQGQRSQAKENHNKNIELEG